MTDVSIQQDEIRQIRQDKLNAELAKAMANAAEVIKACEAFLVLKEYQEKLGAMFLQMNQFIVDTKYFPEDMHEMHKKLHGIIDRILKID